MSDLAKSGRPFHSEADFQHNLAWKIKEKKIAKTVRLEVPFPNPDLESAKKRIYVDVIVGSGTEKIAIELKYKTALFTYHHPEEDLPYDLRNQAAQNLSRYDILKDIQRIQNLVQKRHVDKGFVLALTNDPSLWKDRPERKTKGSEFFLCEGNEFRAKKEYSWGEDTAKGGRERPIVFRKKVKISWQSWGQFITSEKNKEFRYLLVPIGQ
jgi:hypothetical protein